MTASSSSAGTWAKAACISRILSSKARCAAIRRATSASSATARSPAFKSAAFRSITFTLCRTADGHLVDFDGRDADAHGDALAFLAAGADAFVEPQVVADHADVFQRLGTVADQGRI